MNKMTINGIPYLWRSLSYTSPNGNSGGYLVVAYPENDPGAPPIFLIDNNGTVPFGGMSWANWIPTNDVTFEEPNGRKVTW